MKSILKPTLLKQALGFISDSDKAKVLVVSLLQTLLSLLDLIAVGLIGVLGALSVSGIQSQNPVGRTARVLEFLKIENFTFQTQVLILGVSAILILVSKTIVSIIFTRRTLKFLSNRSAQLSADLVSRLLAQPFLKIQSRSFQETIYAITTGVSTLTVGVIGTCVLLISDSALLLVMAIALFLVDPVLAISAILLFGFIALLIYKLLSSRAREVGALNATLSIQGNIAILEVLNSFREIFVRSRQNYYSDLIAENRRQLADVNAERSFMPYIGKYVIETSVLVGAILVAAIQFHLHDAYHAIATLSVFLAAGTRIAPALLRIQQGALQVRTDSASATKTLELIKQLKEQEPLPVPPYAVNRDRLDFVPKIEVKSLAFKYPGSNSYLLNELSLEVQPGKVLAIVGPSGAGKTTLGDLILGLLKPSTGTVLISGVEPTIAISKWPGSIAYVPQDVMISDGTFLTNIALGFPSDSVREEDIWQALEIAQLSEFVRGLPQQLNTHLGERGIRISGGQRQRLGVARAMYTDPRLLILDEATSALDGQTEQELSESIKSLKGKVTIVMIAHRLSTVRAADELAYLAPGQPPVIGDFESIRQQVPDFDNQAKLMGL
jgi:ABC-type multidrug transport system fused ATPase/permease subunit